MERIIPGTIIFQLTNVTQMLSHYWVKEENGNLIHIGHVMGEKTQRGIVHIRQSSVNAKNQGFTQPFNQQRAVFHMWKERPEPEKEE